MKEWMVTAVALTMLAAGVLAAVGAEDRNGTLIEPEARVKNAGI